MPTGILIDLKTRESRSARADPVLGEAGIIIDGLNGPSTVDDLLVGHLVVVDPHAAEAVLNEAGVRVVHQEEVRIVDIEDGPGALAGL